MSERAAARGMPAAAYVSVLTRPPPLAVPVAKAGASGTAPTVAELGQLARSDSCPTLPLLAPRSAR